MPCHTIYRFTSLITVLLFVATTMLLGACTTSSGVRSWVDERTAVAVTAQQKPWTFYRKDIQIDVSIYDFIDLGAFEINQTGTRHQYLCLMEWSTVTRPILEQSRIFEDFSTLVIWADDQPLTFKRYTQNHAMLHLSDTAFKHYTSSVSESYYEISLPQLETLAAAKTLRIAAANLPTDEQPYQTWRDQHESLRAFTEEVTHTAKLMNSDSK